MPHLDVADSVLVVIDAQPGFYGPSRHDVDRGLFASALAHSAIGWREHGVRTIVVHDAVYSAGAGHVNGLARLRAEGVELLSSKELYYEWLRDLPSVRAFDAAHPHLATPPGFSL